MLSKLIFGLTSIAYIALIAVNLYKPKGTGDQLVGWGFVLFAVLAAYGISSLILTVNMALNGRFDWISESKGVRVAIIAAGWLCFMAAIFYITLINADWKVSGTANWLGHVMVQYGALWVPLLMLVPYAILLSHEWQAALSPNTYKIPLLAGSLIGCAFFFLSNKQLSNLFRDKKAIETLKYEKALKKIEFTDQVSDLLYYFFEGTDDRLTQAALAKLEKKENLEQELLDILDNYESNWDYTRVYAYLENHKIEHPELFIGPLNNTVGRVATELKYRLQSFGDESTVLELMNVDGLCRILDTQFKAYKDDFRPNMLRIQEELDKEPKPSFLAIRNKYRSAVKDWLKAR